MIFVECKPDFILVNYATNVAKRSIIHEVQGKGGVCNQLKKRSNCKGLVDEDPLSVQPRYIQEAQLKSDFSEHEIKVLHDESNNNCLIVLCPRLEEWVLKAAREAGIDVRKYGLPNNAAKLHGHINISLDKFENLLEALKDSSSRLKTLKKLLEG